MFEQFFPCLQSFYKSWTASEQMRSDVRGTNIIISRINVKQALLAAIVVMLLCNSTKRLYASQFKILPSNPKRTVFVFEHYFTSLRSLESCVGDGNSQLLTYPLIEWEFISWCCVVNFYFVDWYSAGPVRVLNDKFCNAVHTQDPVS